MKFCELDEIWKRIYTLDWEGLCKGSKAIAALVIDEKGKIISEGRNQIGEFKNLNPKVCHAETECIRNINVKKYPNNWSYSLICALEPCPMCTGTLVMSGIRRVVVAAHDGYGGALHLLNGNPLMERRNIQVEWMPQFYADMQIAFQTIREMLYEEKEDKLNWVLEEFKERSEAGQRAGVALVKSGIFAKKKPSKYSVEEIFNLIEKEL